MILTLSAPPLDREALALASVLRRVAEDVTAGRLLSLGARGSR